MSTFPGSGHHYLVDTGGWSAFEVNARPLDWSNLAFLRPTFANASHAQYYRMPRRHAFTLLEILIAIVIGLMLLLIAVPSVSGMIREQKLRETFQKFDNYVRAAQTRAMRERRTYVMVWDKKGIDLVPLDPTVPDAAPVPPVDGTEPEVAAEEPTFFEFAEDTAWALERPAALVKKPIWEWPFWRSGLCEPVIVHYESEAGSWTAEYSGLTGRGRVLTMEVK